MTEDSYNRCGRQLGEDVQNYTDSIFVHFKNRYGYDLDYNDEACKNDLNQLISDLVASQYMGGLREKAHEYGLKVWCEPYAHSPFPATALHTVVRLMK